MFPFDCFYRHDLIPIQLRSFGFLLVKLLIWWGKKCIRNLIKILESGILATSAMLLSGSLIAPYSAWTLISHQEATSILLKPHPI